MPSKVKEPVLHDVKRYSYQLDHIQATVGAIGALQTISVIPVSAGDSLKVNLEGVFRLSPMRRNMYLDARIDLFAFWNPHRHVYGDDWINFMLGGQDEAITLGTDTMAAGVTLNCLGTYTNPSTALPRWFTRTPIQIWNRYFRDPSDVAGILAENYFTTLTAANLNEMYFGLKCAHLKRLWNTAINPTLTTADYRVPLTDANTTVDLYDFHALQGRLKTEQQRDWFSLRYSDLMKYTYGSRINIDADKRPELIMHTSHWLSGSDINGTDDATLGTYAGKGIGVGNLSFPFKFFPEHGSVWLMALLRFPPVLFRENHYLIGKSEPTYAQISGDPALVARSGPVALAANEIFVGAAATALGNIPHSNWYREHPSFAHDFYNITAGHPFLTMVPTTRNEAIYIDYSTYDATFFSTQLKHWNAQCNVQVDKLSYVPDPRSSIFAGTGGVSGS